MLFHTTTTQEGNVSTIENSESTVAEVSAAVAATQAAVAEGRTIVRLSERKTLKSGKPGYEMRIDGEVVGFTFATTRPNPKKGQSRVYWTAQYGKVRKTGAKRTEAVEAAVPNSHLAW
jgi:hypothetical protein